MPCYKPLKAFQCLDGSIVFAELKRNDIVKSLELRCGQCVGCRLERSRQWAVRCMHEASLYKNNCFLTLTYSDEYLPDDYSLHYEDFQKFMKRLRKRFKGLEPAAYAESTDKMKRLRKRLKFPIRFYMAGEYGEQFGRPHFHACIFNFDFSDKYRDWETDRKSTRLNSSHLKLSRMPSSA